MKKSKTDKEDVQFINETLHLNNEAAAEMLCEKFERIISRFEIKNKSKKDSSDDSAIMSAFFNELLKLKRVVNEKNNSASIDELLNIYYQINLSYLKEEESKIILEMLKAYSKKKVIYYATSFSDMKELIKLFESHAGDIISKFDAKYGKTNSTNKYGLQNIIYLSKIFKMHSAVCALKEIADIRSKNKKQDDIQLIDNIINIILYSFGPLNKTDTWLNDPELHKIILSAKGQDNIKIRWEPISKLKEEAREIANNLWSDGETKYHDEVAKDIYNSQRNSHPEIRGIMEFSENDFRAPKTVRKLCEAINKDSYNLQLKKPDNTIDRLNEMLKMTDLVQWLDEKYDKDKLPPDVNLLFGKTREIRELGEPFNRLEEKDRENVLKLNRIILEIIYPNETPKRPEKDLSKFYSVKVVREAIGTVAEKYGRKRGAHTPKK